MSAYVLYRFFDANERLLYVGRSSRIESRLSEHKKRKPWQQVVKITLTHYPSAEILDSAERHAIDLERPEWNEVLNRSHPEPARAETIRVLHSVDGSAVVRPGGPWFWPDWHPAPDNCVSCGRPMNLPLAVLTYEDGSGGVVAYYVCPNCNREWIIHWTCPTSLEWWAYVLRLHMDEPKRPDGYPADASDRAISLLAKQLLRRARPDIQHPEN